MYYKMVKKNTGDAKARMNLYDSLNIQTSVKVVITGNVNNNNNTTNINNKKHGGYDISIDTIDSYGTYDNFNDFIELN